MSLRDTFGHNARCDIVHFKRHYIIVQLTVHVSVSGLPVLTILYRLILMHKRTKSQNCVFLCFIKVVAFKKNNFLHFLNFWSISSKKGTYWSKAKLIYLYRVELFTFTPILRHIE